ncbi:MAG: RnfABCDGE type electron transport complex subunit D [Spirochaetaceae bacterium]|nr:RnfABCDGE type electron transport complex subunit D [Spirochaetaceae bacterium]
MELNSFNFAPFTYSQYSLSKKNIVALIVLFIHCLILFFVSDYQALLHILTSVLSVLFVSFILSILNKQKDWFSINLITEGTIIGFCVPTSYNPLVLFLLVGIAYFLIKGMFAGYGGNIISVVAFTVAFLYFSFPAHFPEIITNQMIKAQGNMLSTLHIKGLIKNDKAVTSMLNYFFSNLGIIIPEGYANLLASYTSTIPAFRYNIITLFFSALLLGFDFGERIISFTFIFVYGVLVYVFGMSQIDGSFFNGDVIAAFCTTGIFFYAFFVVGENCTVPNTFISKLVYGIILGLLTFFLAGIGGSPIGIAFAIIISNLITPVFLRIEEALQNRFLRKKYGTIA